MAGSRILRAAWRVLRRLLEAALVPESGQSRSITCARWSRWLGARASSFTRLDAFLRRHAPLSMVLEPTDTLNPPSRHTRMASDRFTSLESVGGHTSFHCVVPIHCATRLEHVTMNRR